MEIKLNIKKPAMPSKIFMEVSRIVKKQDGFKPSIESIDVADLNEDQAYEYAELMKVTFIDHWKQLSKHE